MRQRAPFDGVHQRQALRGLLAWSDGALRTRSGKKLPAIAKELGISRATLDRYLSGKTPLSSDQFGPFASAFETDRDELLRACFPVLAAGAPPVSLELNEPSLSDLLTSVGMPDDEKRQLLSSMAGQETTAEERRAIATFVADVLDKRKHAPPQARRQA
jgi:transcriptional regulator with XRE-family HTH domain